MINQAKQQVATIEALREGLIPVTSRISVDVFDNFSSDDGDEGLYLYVDLEKKQVFFTAINHNSPDRDIEGQGSLFGVDRLFSPFSSINSVIGYDKGSTKSFNKCLHDYIVGKAIYAQSTLDSVSETDEEGVIKDILSNILDPYSYL